MSEPHIKTEPAPDQDAPTSASGAALDLGRLLWGRFRVHDVREGGFGYVAAVRDERADLWYAVKIPKVAGASIDFQNEVSFWLTMPPHVNIVRAFHVRELDGRPALFLEYVGPHARNTLRAWLGGAATIEPETAFAFMRQTADGMAFANARGEIAHLDLKPENLMVTEDGVVKVTDFGLARRVVVVRDRYPMVSNGTWPYVAPEWFSGNAVDSRADIYACGVILYEMLTGRTPFGCPSGGDLYGYMKHFHESGGLRTLTSRLYYEEQPGLGDRRIAQLISHCLQWYPGDRPGSFGELVAALSALVHTPTPAPAAQALTMAEEFARAASLCRVGRVDQALSAFNRLMVKEPHDAELWARIADVLEAAGETDTADQIRETN